MRLFTPELALRFTGVALAALLTGACSGSDPVGVPRISVLELMAAIDAGEYVTIVDTRSTSSYASRHIAGSISVPYYETEERLGEFPTTGKIVFYCTCPAENSSAEAAEVLQEHGHVNVYALVGGLEAWLDAGYPTEP